MIWAALALALLPDTVALPNLDPAAPSAQIQVDEGELLQPKRSPSRKQEYRYRTTGIVDIDGKVPRFRIFSQTEDTHRHLAQQVARELLRLWQLCYAHLGRDHALKYNKQLVDVYLTETGEAGGEQLFGLDPDSRKDVNAIFIYDLKSFTNPFEMCREIAHEYGHATLPPVGGYTEGESWINGDLGEIIYLRALRDQLRDGLITTNDTMGASLQDLQSWVEKEADPLMQSSATRSPGEDIRKTNAAGRASFLGFASYAQSLLPASLWRRSITLFGSVHAVDYFSAVQDAVGEATQDVVLTIPPALRRTPIWIPTNGKKLPKAMILARIPGWTKIDPKGMPTIRLGSTTAPDTEAKVGSF